MIKCGIPGLAHGFVDTVLEDKGQYYIWASQSYNAGLIEVMKNFQNIGTKGRDARSEHD